MSERTYTRVVQALILFVVVTGAFYSQPAASAVTLFGGVPASSSTATEKVPCPY